MLRLISILLLLAGLAAAGYAGSVLLEEYAPHDSAVEAAPAGEMALEDTAAPVEAVEAAPVEEAMGMAMADDEFMEDAMGDVPDSAAGAPRSVIGDVFPEGTDIASGFGPPPATTRSAAVQPSSSESFIESLKTVPVAHETPASAEYKRAFDVTLAIDSTGDGNAAEALPGRGNVVETEALVSERVEARLSGANFDIKPMSPEIQSLSPLTENVWRWSVTPLSAGNHDLVFEIYAIDEDSVVPLRTFRDTVTVNVSGINRAIAFADQANPLFVLLGGLGSAIAGLIGLIRFFGRR